MIEGDDLDELTSSGIEMCTKAFGRCRVAAGVVTYVSRGTDDDAARRARGAWPERRDRTGRQATTGWDVITVTLRKADLERVPESRVHTALEASLNCEVHIVVRC